MHTPTPCPAEQLGHGCQIYGPHEQHLALVTTDPEVPTHELITWTDDTEPDAADVVEIPPS